MDTHQKTLIDFIKRAIPIADKIAVEIATHYEPVIFCKNDFILKEGQICNATIFLESGWIRTFTFDVKGNEITTGFYTKNTLVFEVASFFKRTPTKEYIQALTDCVTWSLSYEKLQLLFHTVPEFREFGRLNLVNGFSAAKERMLAMINLTAEERYANLISTRPEIFQNASLKHIATYLGITDTSLSRIRREFAKKT